MEDDNENDARGAAQGLLDIAIKASRKNVDSKVSRPEPIRPIPQNREIAKPNFAGETSKPPDILTKVSVSSSPSGGRIITSGDYAALSRPREEVVPVKSPELRRKGEFQQPKPRKSVQSERVTLIIQRPSEAQEEKHQPPRGPAPGKGLADAEPLSVPSSSIDLPVPPSAFAALVGSGDSGKSSTDFTPLVAKLPQFARDASEDETESDEDEKEDATPPHKRQRLARSVSINTVLNRVGRKEQVFNDVVGTAPQTVQEIVSGPAHKDQPRSVLTPTNMDLTDKRISSDTIAPKGPFLMPRNSSDQSTVDIQKHLAQHASGDALNGRKDNQRNHFGLRRSYSAERDLHQVSDRDATVQGHVGRENADHGNLGERENFKAQQIGNIVSAGSFGRVQDKEDEGRTVMWTGNVKHRLRTSSGASVVELFSLDALVPAKLVEQMPSTLFVNGIIARQNVKLGKHYVAQCRLGNLSERQLVKVNSLASMKMVAICELQHCTITLVPHHGAEHELKMTAFMIADD